MFRLSPQVFLFLKSMPLLISPNQPLLLYLIQIPHCIECENTFIFALNATVFIFVTFLAGLGSRPSED